MLLSMDDGYSHLAAKGLGAIVAIYVVRTLWKKTAKDRRLRAVVSRIQSRKSDIESRLRSKLDAVRNEKVLLWRQIQAMEMQTLLAELKSGKLKAVDVLQAFQDRALRVNDDLNCITSFVESAEGKALKLDALSQDQQGPLHGLPISVKECYLIKGCYSTAGLAHLVGDVADEDALIVQQVEALGAIPFCQTNVPQTMYALQTSNPLYGATGNPYDFERECGGSSGGEGCLVGASASLLGIGNDIGGSVRSPAALCGAYSLKPTHGRHLTQRGAVGPFPASESILPKVVGGFLCSSAASLVEATKLILASGCGGDFSVAPVPWSPEKFSEKRALKIGYFTTLGAFYEPHPGCCRAVLDAVDCLKKRGHTVVQFAPPDLKTVQELHLGFIGFDRLKGLGPALDRDLYDPATKSLWVMKTIEKFPNFMADLLSWLLAKMTLLPAPTYFDTPMKIREGIEKYNLARNGYLDAMKKEGIDVLLGPGSLFPAPVKGSLSDLVPVAVLPYSPWNVLNMPAGIAPITQVTEKDDEQFRQEYPKSDLLYRLIRERTLGSIGLPLSVQVIAPPFEEEIVLRIMTELEACTPKLARKANWAS